MIHLDWTVLCGNITYMDASTGSFGSTFCALRNLLTRNTLVYGLRRAQRVGIGGSLFSGLFGHGVSRCGIGLIEGRLGRARRIKSRHCEC
jgi:hypothetical protein